MTDHRADQRRRVLKAGVVSFNQGHSTLSCQVRDMSETSCQVITEGSASVPDTFQLYIELDGMVADCEVTRRDGDQTGVRFVSEPRYSEPKRVQVVQAAVPDRPGKLRRKGARIIKGAEAAAE